MRPDEALPAVFADPVVRRASHWVLSTSAIYAKNFGPYGWGEVVPDGFGVAYTAGFDHHLVKPTDLEAIEALFDQPPDPAAAPKY